MNPCLRIEWRRFTICSAPKVRSLAGLQGLLRDWPSRWFERFSDRMSDFEQSQQFKLPQVLCVISVPFFARTPEGTIAVFQNVSDSNCTLQHPASAPCTASRTLSARPYLLSPALPVIPAAKPTATQKQAHCSDNLSAQLSSN